MNIRAYRCDDLPAIIDIYDHSKLDELKYESTTFILLPLPSDAIRFSKLMEAEIYVHQEQEQITAYGAICAGEIRALFVHPDYRRKGVGRKLLEFLLTLSQGHIRLHVAHSNLPAINLYRQYGFTVTKTFETFYNQQSVVAQTMVLERHPEHCNRTL